MYIMTRDKECKYGLLTAWSLSGYEVYEVTFQRISSNTSNNRTHIYSISYIQLVIFFVDRLKKYPCSIIYSILYVSNTVINTCICIVAKLLLQSCNILYILHLNKIAQVHVKTFAVMQ